MVHSSMERSRDRALLEGSPTRTPQGVPSPMNRKRMQRWILDRWLKISRWTELMVKLMHDFGNSLYYILNRMFLGIPLEGTTTSYGVANRLKPKDESRPSINRFHTPAEYKLIDT
ncbi:unnamed protein product [Xylocopa violacea]|uniref:Uncharacterized protein n=1 Tax=Xylocopa violacea TaxID=135666 RepID=A0ABP1NQJ2_XYLVO